MTYLNQEQNTFRAATRDVVYIDKTGLIGVVNRRIDTSSRYICLSRPRRFGKSIGLTMLADYYTKGFDCRELFAPYAASKLSSFETHRNKYNVFCIDMQSLVSRTVRNLGGVTEGVIEAITETLVNEVRVAFPQVNLEGERTLDGAMATVFEQTGEQFVVLIDEWDAIFRNYEENFKLQESFVDFLRDLFKGASADKYIAFAYITGILPVKKYNTESALNNFKEYTMIDPGDFATYFGFTEDETRRLCEQYGLDVEEALRWYDGYLLNGLHMTNPKSIVEACERKRLSSYWTSTGSYDNILRYIQMDYEGLKQDVIKMLEGARCRVDVVGFKNTLFDITSKNDCLTVLVHLGYLAYEDGRCFIPNAEIAAEFRRAVSETGWHEIIRALRSSRDLMDSIIDADEKTVARLIDAAHTDYASVFDYNDENSLACVLTMATYAAREDWLVFREFNSGKGRADMVFMPSARSKQPVIVVELKANDSADSALDQIKHREYPASFKRLDREFILVGVNYDKTTKAHTCRIEHFDPREVK